MYPGATQRGKNSPNTCSLLGEFCLGHLVKIKSWVEFLDCRGESQKPGCVRVIEFPHLDTVDNAVLCGGELSCTLEGVLTASLIYTHWMPVHPPPQLVNNKQCPPTLSNVPWRAKLSEVERHW